MTTADERVPPPESEPAPELMAEIGKIFEPGATPATPPPVDAAGDAKVPDDDDDPEGKAPAGDPPADGKPPVADPAAAKPPEKPATDPAKADPAAPAKKPSDELGDLPQDAKAATKQRWEQAKVKFDEQAKALETTTADLAKAEDQLERFIGAIEQTKATPQQYQTSLAYLADVNSGDRTRLLRAHEALTAELAGLSKALGLPGGAYDPLADHADLREEVETGGITRERALEVAQARANKTLDTQVSQTREQQAKQSEAAQKAGAAIQALGAAWRAQDPARFNAVLPAIADKIKELERTVAPEFLPQAIELAYLKHPYTPAPAVAPKAPVGDPLAAGPSGGAAVVQEPKSALEAMQVGMGWR
jgi:hypothetical protein